MRALPLLAIAALLLLPGAAAYPDPQRAPVYYESECFATYDKRFVHDYVDALPARYGREIEGAACEVYARTSAHFVLVAVQDTEGETLETYALRLFERWGIGDERRLDGLLVLYVVDYLKSGEGALRIEVGYGLEGVVNTRVADDAYDLMVETSQEAQPRGDDESSAKALALAAGSAYLLETLDSGYTDAGFPEPQPRSQGPPLLFWILVALVAISIIGSLSRTSSRWGYRSNSAAWMGGMLLESMIRRPPGGGGLGGGFGGGSFGGGRSGGGGRGGRF